MLKLAVGVTMSPRSAPPYPRRLKLEVGGVSRRIPARAGVESNPSTTKAAVTLRPQGIKHELLMRSIRHLDFHFGISAKVEFDLLCPATFIKYMNALRRLKIFLSEIVKAQDLLSNCMTI